GPPAGRRAPCPAPACSPTGPAPASALVPRGAAAPVRPAAAGAPPPGTTQSRPVQAATGSGAPEPHRRPRRPAPADRRAVPEGSRRRAGAAAAATTPAGAAGARAASTATRAPWHRGLPGRRPGPSAAHPRQEPRPRQRPQARDFGRGHFTAPRSFEQQSARPAREVSAGRVLLSCRAVAVEELQPRLAVEAVGGRVDAACGTPEQLRDRRELGGRGRGGVDRGVEQPGDRCTSPRLPAPPPPE